MNVGIEFRMRFMEALCNHQASALAESRTFLVVELTEDDEDVSYLVDEGTRFSSVQQLGRHLTRVTGDEVNVREIRAEMACSGARRAAPALRLREPPGARE